jgi:hypothetical protein
MDKLKQQAIDKAVTHSRSVLSNMGHVTANDEVIAWQADQIDSLKAKVKKMCQLNAGWTTTDFEEQGGNYE